MPESDGGLIGRDEPLARLRTAAEAVAHGRPRVVLVTGEAGIGKTALVDAAAAGLRASGWTTATGRAVRMDSGAPPYLPFVEILEALLVPLGPARARAILGSARDELAGLLPGVVAAPTAEPVSARPDPLHRARMFEAMLDIGERLAAEGPVAIVIEDLQWADTASADLLRFLVDRAESGRLLLLVTARTDDGDEKGRARRLLADLARRRGTDWIELGPLDRAGVARLLGRQSGVAPTSALVDDIARRSGGNPLVAEELAVAQAHGASVSAGLRASILVRVGDLTGPAGALLRTAVLVSDPLDEARLTAISGLDPATTASAVRELLDAQILVLRDDGGDAWLDFRHDVVREIVEETLLPAERRERHRAIAVAAAERPDVASIAPASAAHHWAAAGDRDRAWDAARVAHAAALAVAAYDEALRWGLAALDAWPAGVAASERVGLLRSVAAAALLTGAPRQAVALLRDALATGPEHVDRAAGFEIRSALRLASFAAGDPATAAADAEAVIGEIPPEPADAYRAEALAHLAALALGRRDWVSARALAQEAMATAEAADAPARVALATGVLGLALVELGEPDSGLAAVRQAWAMADLAGPRGYDLAYRRLVSLEARLGRYDDVLLTARRGREVAAKIGLVRTLGRSLTADEADALVQLGRWSEAEALLAPALAEEPDDDDADRLRVAMARLRLRRDGPDAARPAIDVAIAESDAPGRAAQERLGGSMATVRRSWLGAMELAAEAAILDRHPVIAMQTLDAAVTQANAVGAATGMVESGVALEPAATLALWAATEPRPPDDGPSAAHVLGEVRRLVETPVGPFAAYLRAMTARIEDDGASSAAGWAAAAREMAAVGLGWWTGWAQVFAAEAEAGLGHATEAAEALAAASATATALGSTPLRIAIDRLARRLGLPLPRGAGAAREADPAREGPPDRPVLTSREREVLDLLAQGFTNRQIADRLAISHKTASVHVSNILGKLEVENRTEAAAVALRLGLTDQRSGT